MTEVRRKKYTFYKKILTNDLDTSQTSLDFLIMETADDSAYQPTIPLMRIIKEECFSDFDEFEGDQSNATVDQEVGVHKDMVSYVDYAN